MELQHVLDLCVDLPAFPAIALRVAQACGDSETNAFSLSQLVMQDPALTTRMLRLANSSYYGMQRRVRDLTEAIVLLGLRNVRHLSLVAATYGWMDGVGIAKTDALRIWRHSLATGVGAALIAGIAKVDGAEEAFTAGLLCDVGRVAMAVVAPEQSLACYDAAQCGILLQQAERESFGFDHAQLGAALGEQWGFADETLAAIRYHHDAQASTHPIAAVCHVADYLTLLTGLGYAQDGVHGEVSEKAMEQLGLTTDDLDHIVDRFIADFEKHESLSEDMNKAA